MSTRLRLLWFNLVLRHIYRRRVRKNLLPEWISEGRDPKAFPGGCAWVTVADIRKAMSAVEEFERFGQGRDLHS